MNFSTTRNRYGKYSKAIKMIELHHQTNFVKTYLYNIYCVRVLITTINLRILEVNHFNI